MAIQPIYNTTKSLLTNVPLPEETRTYKVVSNQQLIDLTLESIYQAGFEVDTESYTMAREGQIANGRYTIKNVEDKEMQLQVGWQNSYNKQLTVKFALGTKILICQNGSVSGDYGSFRKKHIGEVQTYTPRAIAEYIKTAGDVFLNMQKEREEMKQIELSKRVVAELLGRMFIENEFIETTQLNIIKKELSHPTHEYNSASNSLWSLYNYTTYSMKNVHPSLWMENHIDAHKFFVEAAGIIKSEPIKPLILEDPRLKQLSWLDELAEV